MKVETPLPLADTRYELATKPWILKIDTCPKIVPNSCVLIAGLLVYQSTGYKVLESRNHSWLVYPELWFKKRKPR